MASNKRIYFANQQVAFKRDGDTGGTTAWNAAQGVQSVAITTTFNLEQAFELGQLSIYENIEGVPDIEVTLSKVLDGRPLLYHHATNQSSAAGAGRTPTLAGRSTASCLMALSIWPDTADAAVGVPSQQVEASGLFCSSVGFNFPTEDNFTEDVTLVGNNKAWLSSPSLTSFLDCAQTPWGPSAATGAAFGDDAPERPAGPGDLVDVPYDVGQPGATGVNRREDFAFAPTVTVLNGGSQTNNGWDYCRLPNEIPGVDADGWMSARAANNVSHISSITVSTDLGREDLFELGTRQPYTRPVTFPVEVTCDIEVLSVSGDLINAFADGCGDGVGCDGIVDNLSNQVIRVATCDGTRIYLGDKNKLASVNYGGGDAGGGNVTVTYSYTTFNDFTVIHPADPDASGSAWWRTRSGYLGFNAAGAPA